LRGEDERPIRSRLEEISDARGPTLNLVFCGTPRFAVPTLTRLVESGHRVHLVVTQPDRPSGRGLELALSPVKQTALDLALPVAQPDKIKNNEAFRAQLAAIHPDAIIVVGYGRIIPQWMIDLPPLGNLNLHASLLPKYRGAAPIQWAIASGETITGVTTMRIDAGLDTGDILLQSSLPIEANDTAETLAPKLAAIGADLMLETLRGLEAGAIQPQPQEHSKATLAPILKKEDGQIDFHRTAQEICNRLRGFQPWPGAYTSFRGKNLHIWDATAQSRSLPPGEILIEKVFQSDNRQLTIGNQQSQISNQKSDLLLVGCSGGTAFAPLEVQPEGKKRMKIRDFIHGYHPKNGERLGQ
jgi:methionyl-tRNA formyltransferase